MGLKKKGTPQPLEIIKEPKTGEETKPKSKDKKDK